MKAAVAGLVLAGFVLGGAAHSQSPSDAQTTERAAYTVLLLDESPAVSVMAARAISLFYPRDPAFGDILAELLMDETRQGDTHADAQSWYAKVLGETRNSRYRSALARAREMHDDNGVRKSIDVALQLTSTGVEAEQYARGHVNLKLTRESMRELLAAPQGEDRSLRVMDARSSLVAVFRQLGAPDGFSTAVVGIEKFGREPQLAAHYSGIGVVLFKLSPGDARRWIVTECASELVRVQLAPTDRHFKLAQMLASLRGAAFRDFVRTRASDVEQYPGAADLLVARLAKVPMPLDRQEDQGSAIAVELAFENKDTSAIETLRGIAAHYSGAITAEAALDAVKKIERNARMDRSRKPDSKKRTTT